MTPCSVESLPSRSHGPRQSGGRSWIRCGKNVTKLSDSEILGSRRGEATDPKADAALKFARAVVDTRGGVGDQDVEAIRAAGYDDEQIAEIVAHVALNVLTNYFNKAAQVEIDFPRVEPTRVAA